MHFYHTALYLGLISSCFSQQPEAVMPPNISFQELNLACLFNIPLPLLFIGIFDLTFVLSIALVFLWKEVIAVVRFEKGVEEL